MNDDRDASGTDFSPLDQQGQMHLSGLIAAYGGDRSQLENFLPEHWQIVADGAVDSICQTHLVVEPLTHAPDVDQDEMRQAFAELTAAKQRLLNALKPHYGSHAVRQRARDNT